MTVGGLILAAGEGRRFGGTKQLADLRGRPLLSYAVEAMLAVPAVAPVVVVLGHAADEIRSAVAFDGAETVVCAGWQEGQSASLRCGIDALGAVDAAVIMLGDQPFITPQVIAAVLDQLDRHEAVRATYGGVPGHPVGLGRRLLARAAELRGDVGFRDLLAGEPVHAFEASHLCDPTDIDTREELAGR
ncbi:MAG TPA: nucleotidyltransferase family protein [Solirubrobacteraceae bacterium]|nr:nucleotidyltransferase family protein [Solirubrobacteraceae bacterium]